MRQRRKAQTWYRGHVPIWVEDAKVLKEVIIRYLENRYYLEEATGMAYDDRMLAVRLSAMKALPGFERTLDELIRYKAQDVPVQALDTRIVLEKRGIPELVASIVYMYYRLGYNSTGIYEEIKVKPPHVRIILHRLRLTWRRMCNKKRDGIRCHDDAVEHVRYDEVPVHGQYVPPAVDPLLYELVAFRS